MHMDNYKNTSKIWYSNYKYISKIWTAAVCIYYTFHRSLQGHTISYNGGSPGGAAALYHTTRAFAAVLQNGSICAWGELSCGGDSTPVSRFGFRNQSAKD